jgi:hypothetical protein
MLAFIALEENNLLITEKLELHTEAWYEDDEKSIAFVTLNGLNDLVVNKSSSMGYEVLAGCGVFMVGDSCVIEVCEGSIVSIPSGT